MHNKSNKEMQHEVKIKYDCSGGYENCGQEKMLKLNQKTKKPSHF